MATVSRLYDIARSPPRTEDPDPPVSAWEMALPTLPSLPTYRDLPEGLRTEVEAVMDNANQLWNHTCQELEGTFHMKQRYKQVESQVGGWSEAVGLGHIPSDVLLQSLLFVLAIGCMVLMVGRRLQRQRRHRALYGENAFPPLARAAPSVVMGRGDKTQLPWLYQRCAEQVGSSVFRLRQQGSATRNVPMVVAVGDLVTAKEILRDAGTAKPQQAYTSMAKIAYGGPNIVTSEGALWKMSRKAVSPAFLKKHLDRMHQVCKDETEEWITDVLKPCIENKRDFDVGKQMELLTLSIMCKVAFEYKIKPKEGAALMHELNIMSKEFGFDEANSPFRAKVGFLLPSVKRAKLARTRVHDFAKKILSVYRKRISKAASSTSSSLSTNSSAGNEPATEDTIISCIARCKKYENDSHRIADIVMFLYSSIDNTAYSLAWTLLELAKHPKEAKKLKDALNGNDDSMAQEMLKDVLREGMRLRPPTPGIGMRTIGKNFYLKDKSIVIPKGSRVFFPSLLMTRSGVEDAESFCPSRWRDHPDKSFLLFSTGPRNCVGQSLALAEITWVLSRICAKYDLEVTEEGTAEYGCTIKCVGTRVMVHAASSRKNKGEDIHSLLNGP